jgi:valine--pyruvate aminotransferase
VPFPNIVFSNARPVFDEHVIYCMSLSKLGLPGLRTGIVVARSEIIEAVRSMNAILSLATGSLGAGIVTPLVASGEILRLGREVIQPYYRARVERAVSWCHEQFAGLDYFIHKPEGAIFLWLWFPGLPITAARLYERLKERNVLIIPGHYFFPGLNEPWEHVHECIRISYAQSSEQVEQGIRIIADEVKQAFRGARVGET